MTVIQKMLRPVKRYATRLAEQQGVDRQVKKMSSWQLLLIMVFAQMEKCESGCRLETEIQANAGLTDELDVAGWHRSNLTPALHNRYVYFARIVLYLVRQVQGRGSGVLAKKIGPLKIIDATMITLALSLLPWAALDTARQTGAVKMTVCYDYMSQAIEQVALGIGRLHDSKYFDQMRLLSGVTYLFDAGYYKHSRFVRLLDAGASFICRLTPTAKFQVLETLSKPSHAILGDYRILLGAIPVPLRLVKVKKKGPSDRKTGKRKSGRGSAVTKRNRRRYRYIFILTNRFDLTAEQLATLYAGRWQIELFFRWLKRTLTIKHFFSTDEQAVYAQILTAVITYLLILLTTNCRLQLTKAQRRAGMRTLLQAFRILAANLFQPAARCSIFRGS